MPTSYKSLISTEGHSVDDRTAVVSLVRKPHGRNPEHVFILL